MLTNRILAKVTRAKQHIEDFRLGLHAFAATGPYGVAMKEDAAAGKRIYYMTKIDPIPDNLTAIAADVIQNLRSPLDHIAYQLVLAGRGGTEPDWTVYYPISGSAAYYPTTRAGKIKGVRQEVIDAIDATEPYKGGKGHVLWQLNELNKPDKHELLTSAAVFNTGINITPGMIANMPKTDTFNPDTAIGTPLFLRESRSKPLNLGDELYSEPLDFKMAKKQNFLFEISLNAPGVITPEPAMKTLQDMANLVEGIVTQLGRFLP